MFSKPGWTTSLHRRTRSASDQTDSKRSKGGFLSKSILVLEVGLLNKHETKHRGASVLLCDPRCSDIHSCGLLKLQTFGSGRPPRSHSGCCVELHRSGCPSCGPGTSSTQAYEDLSGPIEKHRGTSMPKPRHLLRLWEGSREAAPARQKPCQDSLEWFTELINC